LGRGILCLEQSHSNHRLGEKPFVLRIGLTTPLAAQPTPNTSHEMHPIKPYEATASVVRCRSCCALVFYQHLQHSRPQTCHLPAHSMLQAKQYESACRQWCPGVNRGQRHCGCSLSHLCFGYPSTFTQDQPSTIIAVLTRTLQQRRCCAGLHV
jgi:hypothetical protein